MYMGRYRAPGAGRTRHGQRDAVPDKNKPYSLTCMKGARLGNAPTAMHPCRRSSGTGLGGVSRDAACT